MVPPWVPDASAPPETQHASPDGEQKSPPDSDTQVPPNAPSEGEKSDTIPLPFASVMPALAPAGRFRNARSNFSSFATGGNASDMKRGVKHYVRQGYGGASKASARFGGAARTAEAVFGALSGIAGGQAMPPGIPLDPALLQGKSAREIIDAVVEAVRPADGTQDAESERAATRDALAELLTQFPDADLLNLSEEQRQIATERFVAINIFRRMQLDIGKTIQDKAPTAAVGLARLKDVKDYVKETVAAAFRKLKGAGTQLTKGRVGEVVKAALRETFEVFEGYL